MRRTFLLVAVVTLAATMFVPATAAEPTTTGHSLSKQAEGTWSWVNTTWDQWKTTNKGGAYASGTEAGTWTGTFEGTAVETFGAQIFPDDTLWALIEIAFEGTVEDRAGTLQILTTAVLRDPDGTMHGRWTIISGTGELANLRGQGTWVYEGADPMDHASYSGIIKEFVPPST